MPRKTNTDLIIELKEVVATLTLRADKADETFERIDIEAIRERLTRIELLLEHREQTRREGQGRNSLAFSSVLSAIVGAVIGALTTYLLQRFTAT